MKPLNRRRFLQSAAGAASVFAAAVRGALAAGEPGAVLFVGTQTTQGSRGIYAFAWNAERGAAQLLGLAAEAPMPTFLALSHDRRLLFAANETEEFAGRPKSGGVSSFKVGRRGKLALINAEPSGGAGTCHIGLDPSGRALLCANYTGGSASSFAVDGQGRIASAASHFQYSGTGPNPDRQEAPHVHRATVSPGGRFALFNDLGLDQIHIYALDPATAKLTEPTHWQAPSGSGPRALVFHPNGRWAYCTAELRPQVIGLAWDEGKGMLTTEQEVMLDDADFHGRSQAADSVLDRAGRFLYAANRYHDGVHTFAVDPGSGRLTLVERTKIQGKVPRHLSLDPSGRWLLLANQESDTIEILPRDSATGKLGPTAAELRQSRPQCLVFV